MWAVLIELGIMAAACVWVYRLFDERPPPAALPPSAGGNGMAALEDDVTWAADNAEACDLLVDRLDATGFNKYQREKVLPVLLPRLKAYGLEMEPQGQQEAIDTMVLGVRNEFLKQGAQVGVTHAVTVVNLAMYSYQLYLAVSRLLAGPVMEAGDDWFPVLVGLVWDEADVHDPQEQGSALLHSIAMVALGLIALPFTWVPTITYYVLGRRAQLPAMRIGRTRGIAPVMKQQ